MNTLVTRKTWCNEPRKCRILIFTNCSLKIQNICTVPIRVLISVSSCAYQYLYHLCTDTCIICVMCIDICIVCVPIHASSRCVPRYTNISPPPSVPLYVMSVLPDMSKVPHHCFLFTILKIFSKLVQKKRILSNTCIR